MVVAGQYPFDAWHSDNDVYNKPFKNNKLRPCKISTLVLLGCVCGIVYSGLFVMITKAVLLYIIVSVDEIEIMEIINKTVFGE